MPNVAAVLADVARALNELGVRWYVFGAQAAIHYGSPRSTADVDLTIEADPARYPDLLDAFSRVGIWARVDLDSQFVHRTRVLPLVHSSGMDIDVVLAGPGLEELFMDNARLTSIGGTTVPMASATDIVVMKVLAGRPKDLEDVAGIVRASPSSLDLARVRELLEGLGELLDRADLVSSLDAILERR
jgi:predicted nucleotidyltransferase